MRLLSNKNLSIICGIAFLMMQDCGQPGFTLAERKRFGNILKEYVTPLENFVSMVFLRISMLKG